MNIPTWARNVIAAFIYGAVNVITVVVVDPIAFNFGEQWKKTQVMAFVGGVLGAARYLEKWLAPVALPSGPTQHRGKAMRSLTRIAIFVAVALVAQAFARAQDRQVEINADLPAKRGLVTSDIALAGRVYLPAGNFTVVGDVSFQDAVNLFLVPTAQIDLNGQVWFYFTGAPSKDAKSIKPFVYGGLTRAMFIGEPADSTTGLAGFGITIRKPTGFTVIPAFQFDSDDFEDGRTVLGRNYSARVYLHIPLGKDFNLNLTPKFGRQAYGSGGGYNSEYSLSVGFSRKF